MNNKSKKRQLKKELNFKIDEQWLLLTANRSVNILPICYT